MRYELLSFNRQNQVMLINLHNLEIGYPNLYQLTQELRELCNSISLDQQLQVVVIHWDQAKPSRDLKLDQYLLTTDSGWAHLPSCADIVSNIDLPVIVAMSGYVIGPALELALACDIRIASLESYFGLPHIHNGIIPWDGGTQRLSRLVGKSCAMEMILTGQIINSEEALKIGLVNRLSEGRQLVPSAMEMAQQMAVMSPLALKYTKEVVLKGMELTLDQGLRLEADVYFLLHTSNDRTEGIRAFKEKRKPRFTGD